VVMVSYPNKRCGLHPGKTRVRGEEQETRYLARMGKCIGPTQNAQSAQHLISILARNQARRHWVYSGHYPRIFVAPNNARNTETKHRSGAGLCLFIYGRASLTMEGKSNVPMEITLWIRRTSAKNMVP
jgi:hypothetical protein